MTTGHSQARLAVRPERPPVPPADLARDIACEARSRGGLLLIADHEAILGPTVRDRRAVSVPLLVRGALVALATAPNTRVIITSDEDPCRLETLINVPGVVYAGSGGLQIRGAGLAFCHPVAARARERLPHLAQELSEDLALLPGVDVETTELGLVVQVRGADAAIVPVIVAQLEEVRRAAGGAFRVRQSESAISLIPDAAWRKGSAALWIMEQWMREGRGEPLVVSVGMGDPTEDAYHALRRHGYGVHIGRVAGKGAAASHWVADQAAAVDLLGRIAFVWSVQSQGV
jgi:trehalose-phosphatase